MDPANPKPSMKRRITVAGSVGALAALAVVGAATMTGGPGESTAQSRQRPIDPSETAYEFAESTPPYAASTAAPNCTGDAGCGPITSMGGAYQVPGPFAGTYATTTVGMSEYLFAPVDLARVDQDFSIDFWFKPLTSGSSPSAAYPVPNVGLLDFSEGAITGLGCIDFFFNQYGFGDLGGQYKVKAGGNWGYVTTIDAIGTTIGAWQYFAVSFQASTLTMVVHMSGTTKTSTAQSVMNWTTGVSRWTIGSNTTNNECPYYHQSSGGGGTISGYLGASFADVRMSSVYHPATYWAAVWARANP